MDDKLYNLCDWGEIEEVVYSEHDNPHNILGPHITEDGILIQAFIPTAIAMTVKVSGTDKEYNMERVDKAGYYVILIPGKKLFPYTYFVTYDNGTFEEISDPYSFEPVIDAVDRKQFTSGIHYTIYDKLGAHPMELDGIKGVLFAVWAPNAIRVSVVGDFNLWDGRRHQMRRLGDSGIFELFIPGLKEGELYKYEIKIKGGLVMLKADPYANYAELRPNTASVVYDISKYEWKDNNWLTKRKKLDMDKEPMVIYEVHLGSFKKPTDENRDFYNYRELAPMLADYVIDMGYTHIELLPIMEHPLDASWGYQVTGYYAATSRYGTPEDLMYFIDYMHKHNIGVILDWVPAHFPRDAFGLANFDGTCLYEHLDPRQGSHPQWGTLIYNYGRPQVANFLIANAIFWVEKYHIDAIRMDAVASMLYLDYGKSNGEWVANIYGGNENLEAIALLKQLSTVLKERNDGNLLIAEESTAWPQITGNVEDGGLGFDYKWNMGWMNDFTNYMKCDPLFRKGHHNELTFSMVYNYSEKFILVLSHDEVVHEKGSMINKMPGDYEQKFANLRVAYGFMMAHPGKKLLFMGQDIAQFDEWNEEKSIEWELLKYDSHAKMKAYVKALFRLYQDYSALYQMDYSAEGFEWINNMDANRSVISFLRKNEKETLLVVCNFTPVVYEDYIIGVPFVGKYKETFNSDREEFGGKGNTNPKLKLTKKIECDDRKDSISITVPPLGICVFTCTPTTEKSNTTKKKTDSDTKKKSKKKTSDYMISSDNIFANAEAKKQEATTAEETKTKKTEESKTEESKTEDTKIKEIKIKETKIADTEKEQSPKAGTKKANIKKEKNKKEETEKETKKVKTEKAEILKAETKKVKTEKAETKKTDTNKVKTEKAETQKADTNKVKTEKAEIKKAETKKASIEKEIAKTEDTKKVKTEKAKKVDTKIVSTEKEKAKTTNTKKAKTEKEKTAKADTKKTDTVKAETEKANRKNVDIEDVNAGKINSEKLIPENNIPNKPTEDEAINFKRQLEEIIEEAAITKEDSVGQNNDIS